MYLFVYKTTHINGKYYIGRHQTETLDDSYLGSGNWIKSIKDKSKLTREIIVEANSVEELYKLEEYYIDLHWDDRLCMNYIKGSNGLSSEDNLIKVKNGNHPFLTRPDGTSVSKDKVNNGTHHLLKRSDGTSVSKERVENGTHHFLTRPDGTSVSKEVTKRRIDDGTHHLLKRPDGTSHASDKVKNGTHHLLKRPDGTSHASDKVKNGTHNFQTRPDGTNLQTDKVENGTHHFLKNKNLVSCYNEKGEYKKIPREQFDSQSGPKEHWEWVAISSKIGRRRKHL
jgi:hypothetical protein